REHATLTCDNESLRYQDSENARPARAWNIDSLQSGMVANLVGCFAMRDLPQDFAFVQINRTDASIRRLWQRKALHSKRNSACLAPRRAGCGGRCPSESPDKSHIGFSFRGYKPERTHDALRRYIGNMSL